ncbi:hypothetical protein CVIRNUC_010504 [Coccomyxa viridis]|uniref:C2 domain-containing protein n=1 Tax=Coccomyxa viridis TaxID=1274662 RepID=A0AAV1IKD5_9CHLO|nr:hypothetical protein CVIRNUC_010504 [Coccomyxa viridis]
MPHKHHRVGLAKLKAKLDKLRVKIKGDKPVSPFMVVRLGSGRVQTKALRDCGCDANWIGSYHIDDVDPNAAQDLEVFVYDAATDGRELIGKSNKVVHIKLLDDAKRPVGELDLEVDPHGADFQPSTGGTAGEKVKVVAATPDAEVVVEEPATPPAASGTHVPCS